MTKYEMLEAKLNSIQAQISKAKNDGTGEKQYAENSYFSKRCIPLENHMKYSNKEPWNTFVKLAKSLFGVKQISSLQYRHADICVDYINELIAIHNKYEKLIGRYHTNESGYINVKPYSELELMEDNND